MSMHSYLPPPPLSHFINEFWLWEGYHPAHPRERILPGGEMELIIFLSDNPLQIFYAANPDQPHSFNGPVVAGARSEYFIVDTAQSASILGVHFKPGVALPFFKASASELHNLHVSLEALWGIQANDLRCQLLEAPTPAEKFCILEQALMEQLLRSEGRHRAVAFALAAFNRAPQAHTVSEVVEQIGLSPTRFIQVFSQEIGLTPKLYCRVLRFQEALRMIVQQPSRGWADIALRCGYYDQSHFINDFQAFAGISPSLYFPQDPQHRTNLAVLGES